MSNGQPADTFLLTVPPPVTLIRYFAPAGVPVTSSSFAASVDLSSVDPQAGTVSVRIEVSSPDSRIRVLGYEPQFMSVQLDPIDQETVPVQVERGVVPPGLDLGDTAVDPATVTVSGPQSAVRQVVAVRADVQIQPSGIDVDQDVQLVPIDGLGNAVRTIDVTPSTARVTIPVFSDRQTRSLPVNAVLSGVPAAGFEVASVLGRSADRPGRGRRRSAGPAGQRRHEPDPDERRVRGHRRSRRRWRCRPASWPSVTTRSASRSSSAR